MHTDFRRGLTSGSDVYSDDRQKSLVITKNIIKEDQHGLLKGTTHNIQTLN